jgi:hypothetical protein
MSTITVSKRTGGGYTVVLGGNSPIYVSKLNYAVIGASVKLIGPAGEINNEHYAPSAWTINNVTSFTTALQIADALDGIGVASGDVLDDMKAILTTIDTDTGALVTSNAALVTKMTDGLQKVQTVNSLGANLFTSTPIREIYASLTRPVDTENYAANDHISNSVGSPLPVLLDDMASDLGEGGIIMDVVVTTNITQLAGQTLRIWLFNSTPSGIVGDNVAFTNLVANASKRVGSGYIDVPLNALLTGSDSIVGVVSPAASFKCASADNSLYALVQTLGNANAPTSAGVINIKFTVIQITK